MHIEALLRMANQIGRFFEAMPDRSVATDDLANHLRKFWEPRMRRQLLAHVHSSGGAGLDPLVAQAIARHRDWLAEGTA